jgi:hypothetical protein
MTHYTRLRRRLVRRRRCDRAETRGSNCAIAVIPAVDVNLRVPRGGEVPVERDRDVVLTSGRNRGHGIRPIRQGGSRLIRGVALHDRRNGRGGSPKYLLADEDIRSGRRHNDRIDRDDSAPGRNCVVGACTAGIEVLGGRRYAWWRRRMRRRWRPGRRCGCWISW